MPGMMQAGPLVYSAKQYGNIGCLFLDPNGRHLINTIKYIYFLQQFLVNNILFGFQDIDWVQIFFIHHGTAGRSNRANLEATLPYGDCGSGLKVCSAGFLMALTT